MNRPTSAFESRHALLFAIDNLTPVKVQGEAHYASRFLKTTMLQHVREDFIFLDGDTLAVRPFADPLREPHSLQMALDPMRNQADHNFPNWVIPHYQRLGWRWPTARYFNSGVMFVRQGVSSEKLFEDWHHRWQEFFGATGKTNDQPALNSAINAGDFPVATLSVRYNAMVRANESYRWGARLLHFFADQYNAESDSGSEYQKLINRLGADENVTFAQIQAAMTRWLPLVEPRSWRRHLKAGNPLGALWSWYNGGPRKRSA